MEQIARIQPLAWSEDVELSRSERVTTHQVPARAASLFSFEGVVFAPAESASY